MQKFKARILASGRAFGRLIRLPEPAASGVFPHPHSHDSEIELRRFKESMAAVSERMRLHPEGERGIARAHRLMLNDPTLHERVRNAIVNESVSAETAVESVMEAIATQFAAAPGPALAARSDDLRDLSTQLVRCLRHGDPHHGLPASEQPAVLLTRELLPSVVFEAGARNYRAFVVQDGTPFAHSIILARQLEIPVVLPLGWDVFNLPEGSELLVDAEAGEIVLDPPSRLLEPHAATPAPTPKALKPDLPLRFWLNVADPERLRPEHFQLAEGVGLFRTEYLFLSRISDFTDEEEQYRHYSVLFEKAGDHPVTVRTLDVGGDKMLPYFSLGPQQNPYLGLRGHRIYRFHPEILITQVRALLRAAANAHEPRILFPMIERLEQMRFVKQLVAKAVESLEHDHLPTPRGFLQGPMIEVPSAAWSCRELLAEADFASLGTNDLFQYFFAADRNDLNVSGSYRPESPAALRLLQGLVSCAKRAGKPMTLCGEIASDTRLLPLLVGLGLKDLSVAPASLPHLAEALSRMDVQSCHLLTEASLRAESCEEVDSLLDDFHAHTGHGTKHVLESESVAVDPVCGMVVATEGNELRARQGVATYYFCSPSCLERFRAG